MTREEAIEVLRPFREAMIDQHGCPISDAVFALDVAIRSLEAWDKVKSFLQSLIENEHLSKANKFGLSTALGNIEYRLEEVEVGEWAKQELNKRKEVKE